MLGRLADRTPYFAPLGELPCDADENRVQCHLCRAWYRALAPSHLSRVHGLTADQYRELVGLRPRHALWARDMVEAQAARLRARLAAEPRLQAAMAKGRALAQRGDLQRQARRHLAERPVSLERQRQLVEGGARLGSGRAAAFRQRREKPRDRAWLQGRGRLLRRPLPRGATPDRRDRHGAVLRRKCGAQ